MAKGADMAPPYLCNYRIDAIVSGKPVLDGLGYLFQFFRIANVITGNLDHTPTQAGG